MFQLNEVANNKLKALAPIIVFFGMSKNEQMIILPILEERKYDFPEGDLVTSNTLEILMNGCRADLNFILIRLMIIQDGSGNENIKDIANLIEQFLELIDRILEENFEIVDDINKLGDFEWVILRQLSLAIQRKLEIEMVVNTKTINNYVEYWTHS